VALTTHPTSRAEVKERVELYLYYPPGPSWSVIGNLYLYLLGTIIGNLYLFENDYGVTFTFIFFRTIMG
jgi:hypothetical protein